jgi:ribosomal protein S18 acetylase RimI-like enzyme
MMLEELNSQNIDAALVLFRNYQEFYHVENIDEEKNRQHLQTILESEEHGKLFLLRDDSYAGFATIYYSFSSILAEKIAILNDLYVETNYRRRGFGKLLMDRCFSYLKTCGINIVRWTTEKNNVIAQQLYDDYSDRKTEWFMYSYKIH